jgi:uncharacterized protein YbjT (DUF2867 family)
MKITLFGATGRTGRYVLRRALEAGHAVTILVRSPEKLDGSDPNLTVLQGDARDPEDVSRAIAGAEAVISTLGPVRGGPMDGMARGAENIVAAMKQHGVRRLIFTTGAGVPAPQDRPTMMSRFMGFLVRTLSREIYEDSLRGAETVLQSGLDWTILRGPMLKDAPFDGSYQIGYVGDGMNPSLSRGNFADCILSQLEDETYLHKIPAVSDA